jgi:UDP-N-acetylglucosamine--N-acetylmuramyl-(pentapeptide) pyrophosphoryl-undecaprenol N-acetylglucosamine transferase
MTIQAPRILIAGGGTGGHLYPGIAVAKELLSRNANAQITFAGTARGIEARVIPREGFGLDLIRSSGLKGKSLTTAIRGALIAPVSLIDAWSIVSQRKPDLVIGVGGYSSGPVVLVASLRGVPTMVLEQNAVPGLTNRLLARFVRAAAVTFDSTKTFFGEKGFVSGNPVRAEFVADAPEVRLPPSRPQGASASRAEAIGGGGKPDTTNPTEAKGDEPSGVQVLVFGGSQGAHAINLAMVEAAPELAAGSPRLRLTHQTGERDVEMVRAAYAAAGIQADVQPFFYDMGRRVGAADLIICRAGATTIAEISAAAKPAILIPLPTATDDHQRRNAEALAAAGAAEVLLQSEATGSVLAGRIKQLAGDAACRARLSAHARTFARPDAAKVIADRAMELISGIRL